MEISDLELRLRDRPGDLASWLAYGDRLLERGDARGTLIRLEQRRARGGPADREALEREIAKLEQEHRKGWDAALPEGVTVLARRYGFATKIGVDWSDDAPAVIERALRDPFVTALRIRPPADADEDDEGWVELDEDGMPIGAPPVEAGALATLDLGRLAELDLSYFRIGDPGARALAASIAKGRIETLDLRYCGIGDDGLAVLAASPHFDRLRRLRLQANALTAEGVRSLARFERLVDLDLRYNRIGADGADALLAAPFAGSLQRLLLYRDDLSDDGVRKLALAPRLPPALRSYWRCV
ncbi:hypothetical protein ACQP1W_33285 [Spirillospora sp. CA-255316]